MLARAASLAFFKRPLSTAKAMMSTQTRDFVIREGLLLNKIEKFFKLEPGDVCSVEYGPDNEFVINFKPGFKNPIRVATAIWGELAQKEGASLFNGTQTNPNYRFLGEDAFNLFVEFMGKEVVDKSLKSQPKI